MVRKHPYFAVTQVEVNGNRRLSREEILATAGVRDGGSVWDASPIVLRERLEANPWVERAFVKREFPRFVAIRVRERTPVAIVSLDTKLSYVDRSGRILGLLKDTDNRDFPIVSGLDTPQAKGFVTVGLHRAMQLLHACERLRCFDEISEIRVDRERGLTLFPLKTRVPVVLGWGQWREKLRSSGRVLAAWQGQLPRLARIDVSYRGIAVVQVREETSAPAARPGKKGIRI